MIFKESYIELYVNDSLVELTSDNSLNVKFHNTLYSPTKLGSSQVEYSFTFEILATKKNCTIFEFANVPSKPNKYNRNYKARLYADGKKVFDGSILLNGYSDGKFSCNLISPKVYDLDDIFGENTLTDIDWYKPFNGIQDINKYNASGDTEVMFPLASYGVFIKKPYYSDDVANDYTSKYVMDKYNKWFVESFYPSLNMLETVKKAFNSQNYEVGGNAFQDEFLKNIYMSTNLASEQTPIYNLAHPNFGTVTLSCTLTTTGNGYTQQLQFPYFKVSDHNKTAAGFSPTAVPKDEDIQWNFDAINLYSFLREGSVHMLQDKCYMYHPEDGVIVIPADGYYKIEIDTDSYLNHSQDSFEAAQWVYDPIKKSLVFKNVSGIPYDMEETTPVEIQLVRNYNETVELIKGKYNKEYFDGNPTHQDVSDYFTINQFSSNVEEWETCYPHEDPYSSKLPTKTNSLIIVTAGTQHQQFEGQQFEGQSSGGNRRWNGGSRTENTEANPRYYNAYNYGYVYKDRELMAYDPSVSDGFICGFSTLGKCPSFLKNGYSWSKGLSEDWHSFYTQNGYLNLYSEAGSSNTLSSSASTKNQNEYLNSPQSNFFPRYDSNNHMDEFHSKVYGMIYLNKNDVLELFAVQRYYSDEMGRPISYSTTNNIQMHIEAASPKSYNMLKANSFGYNSVSEFDYDLRLSNFLNQDKKISDFIKNVLDAYNLELTQTDKYFVSIDKKLNIFNGSVATVDLDNRVNESEIKTSMIDYPYSMAVKYSIDTDEWGFQSTVPEEVIEEDDWLKYGDYGYDVVKLNLNNMNLERQEVQLPYSYCYYYNWKWIEVYSGGTENSANTVTLTLPVISEARYMIDGYNYDTAMLNDGYSLNPRFWMKPQSSSTYVWSDQYPKERINVYIPSNQYNGINLSYKNSETSLLSEYFGVKAYPESNYATVSAYISAEEYNQLSNGAYVKLDDDTYITVELSNYDPSGASPTTIKLMKKP